ncbi:MFS transporter [Paenibacillus brevis]|uniref:MFS transporter n=1 Tax=Paenibacillus brevis TaxID=2841508 RepID=A0ABS6FQN1_9BACL|nr:MFS transporter [Paenibacillus brevis]MBU5671777.1 MFS transporter [Paenibacillus brevis]
MTEQANALTKRQKWAAILENKSFMYLLAARVITRFGDSIDSIAYSWMVYLLTGSKLMMGTLFALNFVPNLVLSFFSGALVDRWSKRRVLIITHVGRGLIVILTAALYATSLLKPWHLYILTLLTSTLECFASPAEISLVPRLLAKEKLLIGNSLSTSITRITELAGLAAAGGIIAIAGVSGAMLVDGTTFFSAALLVGFISLAEKSKERARTEELSRSLLQEVREGIAFILRQKTILTIVIIAAFSNFCLSPFNVLGPAFIAEVLGEGPAGLSIMGISLVSGMAISGLWLARKGNNYRKSVLILAGYTLLGVNYALLYLPGFLPVLSIAAASLFSFGMGAAVSLISTPTTTYFMENVPQEMLGRVGAIHSMICTCAIPLGSLLAGALGDAIRTDMIYLGFGLLLIIPALLLPRHRSFMSI